MRRQRSLNEAQGARKPLFIPLKRVWFEAFASGDKSIEYRRPGLLYNRVSCKVGRPVCLSLGYSGSRLAGVIVSYREIPRRLAPPEPRAIYQDTERIAAITIKLDGD